MLFNLELFGVLLIIIYLKDGIFIDEEYNWFIKMSDINYWILLLVLVLYLIILMIEINYKLRLNLLFLLLLYLIVVSDLLVFFCFMR